MIGPPDSEVVRGTLVSIAQHSLPHQILSATEMKERYGVFHLSEEEIGVWESNAGYLHPEVCIETFIALAKQHLANTHYDEKLLSYERVDPTLAESQGMTLQVVTDRGKYHCKKLILTVGAWANEIYGHALPKSFPLTIERRVLFWFEPTEPDNFELHNQFKVFTVYQCCNVKVMSVCFGIRECLSIYGIWARQAQATSMVSQSKQAMKGLRWQCTTAKTRS